MQKSYHVNEKGYYGQFGGSFVPEMLYPNMKTLAESYLKIMNEPDFQKEFQRTFKGISKGLSSRLSK